VTTQTSVRDSFVVFPLGARRFGLPTADVVELSRTGLVQKFPHTTTGILGILMRRGEILPVWNVAETLLGPGKPELKYWLVTRCNFASEAGQELTAIPVSGECQMLRSEMLPAPEGSAAHVRGVLLLDDQSIEVLDLTRLVTPPQPAASREKEFAMKKEEQP